MRRSAGPAVRGRQGPIGDLAFAHHHGVQAARHREQVFDRALAGMDDQRPPTSGVRAARPAISSRPLSTGVNRGVHMQLEAIAGRQQCAPDPGCATSARDGVVRARRGGQLAAPDRAVTDAEMKAIASR
jgi:hypothetical protein